MSTRKPLTKERILTEALALADAEGLAKLSMRKLGERLGVEAMSLYNHVKNKDALLREMQDEVVGRMAVPGEGPWRDTLRHRAHSAHDVLMRHSWAAPMILESGEPGPNQLAYVEATLSCLIQAGFSYPQADHVWNTLDAYVFGFTIQRLSFPFEPENYADEAAAYVDQIPAEVFPHLRKMAELVAAREHDGVQTLEFGLELLLDGFERLRGA